MLEATDLPLTQTQTDEPSQELGEVKRPWGRLCACISTMVSIDLFEPVYTFGRAPSCNIFVDESQFPTILNVSKQHFRLTKDEEGLVFLTDLSKNGTFVNRTKIGRNNECVIYNEDIIAIGSPSTRVYSFISDINRDDYEFLPQELRLKYTTTKLLGRGSFGQVRLALDKQTREQFAIKRIDKSRSSVSTRRGNNISGIKTEVEILSSFSHAFIIQMREVFETDDEVFLVLEYMSGGELTSRIRSTLAFPECEVKFIFYQILLGVRYLHLNGVTHRDLKPENVLLSTQNQYPRVKISDFGLSKIMDDISVMETVCGTVQYAAPEVLRFFEPYSRKVDVWSLGVILFYMLSRTQPFVPRFAMFSAFQVG
ncbi:serine/threonine-protein kinase Chk2 isoform X2 [Tribolium castaneum]|uniref:serine/threonine-protein kinase Chk2 isoform X2 n=1 Tax=Tribolium castaneum TaxID=7070 RepID=UPI00046C2879|nr:PREDICTED: serine/threonine-protein kinase Chk2 isoform X2 [Tribolium castaneum]|eukprot:XP_008194624.1 PREDICTED: serine/threonine-protein kinase Chk2 isoform X2 [Tribolium castaneum]